MNKNVSEDMRVYYHCVICGKKVYMDFSPDLDQQAIKDNVCPGGCNPSPTWSQTWEELLKSDETPERQT